MAKKTSMHFTHAKRYFNVFILVLFTSFYSYHASAQKDSTNSEAVDPALVEAGRTLFNNNCASCHSPGTEVVVGPGLKGIQDRRELPWIKKWVRSSQEVIASGDPYAVKLYEEYNQAVMQNFDLADQEIESILAYVAAYQPPSATAAATTGNQAQASGGMNESYFNIIVIALLAILLLILVVLLLIVGLLTKFLKQKEGDLDEADKEIINQRIDITAVLKSKALLSIVALFFFLVVAKAGIDYVMDIGMQQGYAPTQPIAFSHKLHAGQYQIDCQYCHTGVRKGKSANIPSANICMNCHGEIKRGSPEIQKIYAAIENDQPIQWVRVHNLPDLVYFNHSQHTVVGELDCQNCHGEIEKMEVVQQRAPLTMGWCIDCHKETVVKAEGNAYYDKLLAAHNNKELKVEDIGGLECSKCHY